jgi:hypothetical protein
VSKYMTYMVINKSVPLREVEAPSEQAAIHKGEEIARAHAIDYDDVVAIPVRDDEDA